MSKNKKKARQVLKRVARRKATAEQREQLEKIRVAEAKLKQIEKLKLEVMARNPMITGVMVGVSSRGVGSIRKRMKVQAWVEILEE